MTPNPAAQDLRLLVFNLATDADDLVLGFTTRWLQAMARRVEHIDVITMRQGRLALPANVAVHSVGKEKGFSEPRRVWEFYRHLRRVLQCGRVDAVFSHMMPVFSMLAGAALRARRIPLVTWYAHASLTPTLRVAHALSNRMVTSVATAYPHHRDKLTPLGQGIDTDLFRPDGVPTQPQEIVYVSRISRVKDQAMLVRAVAALRDRGMSGVQVNLVGPLLTADDAVYAQEVRHLIRTHGLDAFVAFQPPRTLDALPSVYRRSSLAINLTPIGSFDKTGLESMCCGTVTLVANPGYTETLGSDAELLLLPRRDDALLADRIEHILRLPEAERMSIGRRLRERCHAMHSLDSLVDRLLQLVQDLRR